ncbi:hypothetical protein ENSA5_04980 [Enhygromyxa salina]|uniref:Uncharacterized protein n=1 Tax=Enhygromyxa salina TaxID=215803 RepID=A0A2S9YHY7_9BACT|nr:hypothetical protein [Enhygromyxa salina]PRQ04733.1 hypothetical protein ENSA5_04980 [Enhygromyxa salina]
MGVSQSTCVGVNPLLTVGADQSINAGADQSLRVSGNHFSCDKTHDEREGSA